MISTVGEEINVAITSLPATAMISFNRLIARYIPYVELLFKLIGWVLDWA